MATISNAEFLRRLREQSRGNGYYTFNAEEISNDTLSQQAYIETAMSNTMLDSTDKQVDREVIQQSQRLLNQTQQPIETQEEVIEKAESTSNIWDRILDTSNEFIYNSSKGIFGFFEGIGDFFISAAGTIGSWFGADDQWAKDAVAFDWSSRAARGTTQFMGLNLADPDTWNFDYSDEGMQAYEQDLYQDSFMSETPDWLHQGYTGLVQTVSNQLPVIALSMGTANIPAIATGPLKWVANHSKFVSAGTMGLSAGGRSIQEAMQENPSASLSEVLLYGALSGAIEMGTEYMMNIPEMVGIKVFPNTVGALTSITSGNFLAKFAGSIVEEGLEEVASDLLQPFIMPIYNHKSVAENWNDTITWQGIGETFLMGALSSAILGGMTQGSQRIALGRQGYQVEAYRQQVIDQIEVLTDYANRGAMYEPGTQNLTARAEAATRRMLEAGQKYNEAISNMSERSRIRYLQAKTGVSEAQFEEKITRPILEGVEEQDAQLTRLIDSLNTEIENTIDNQNLTEEQKSTTMQQLIEMRDSAVEMQEKVVKPRLELARRANATASERAMAAMQSQINDTITYAKQGNLKNTALNQTLQNHLERLLRHNSERNENAVQKDLDNITATINSILKNGSQSDKITFLMQFIDLGTALKNVSELNGKTIDNLLNGYLANTRDTTVREAVELYRDTKIISRNINQDTRIVFSDNLNENENARYDAERNIIYFRRGLSGRYSGLFAHEYIGHALFDRMSRQARDRFLEQVKASEWYANIRSDFEMRYGYYGLDYDSLSPERKALYDSELFATFLEQAVSDETMLERIAYKGSLRRAVRTLNSRLNGIRVDNDFVREVRRAINGINEQLAQPDLQIKDMTLAQQSSLEELTTEEKAIYIETFNELKDVFGEDFINAQQSDNAIATQIARISRIKDATIRREQIVLFMNSQQNIFTDYSTHNELLKTTTNARTQEQMYLEDAKKKGINGIEIARVLNITDNILDNSDTAVIEQHIKRTTRFLNKHLTKADFNSLNDAELYEATSTYIVLRTGIKTSKGIINKDTIYNKLKAKGVDATTIQLFYESLNAFYSNYNNETAPIFAKALIGVDINQINDISAINELGEIVEKYKNGDYKDRDITNENAQEMMQDLRAINELVKSINNESLENLAKENGLANIVSLYNEIKETLNSLGYDTSEIVMSNRLGTQIAYDNARIIDGVVDTTATYMNVRSEGEQAVSDFNNLTSENNEQLQRARELTSKGKLKQIRAITKEIYKALNTKAYDGTLTSQDIQTVREYIVELRALIRDYLNQVKGVADNVFAKNNDNYTRLKIDLNNAQIEEILKMLNEDIIPFIDMTFENGSDAFIDLGNAWTGIKTSDQVVIEAKEFVENEVKTLYNEYLNDLAQLNSYLNRYNGPDNTNLRHILSQYTGENRNLQYRSNGAINQQYYRKGARKIRYNSNLKVNHTTSTYTYTNATTYESIYEGQDLNYKSQVDTNVSGKRSSFFAISNRNTVNQNSQGFTYVITPNGEMVIDGVVSAGNDLLVYEDLGTIVENRVLDSKTHNSAVIFVQEDNRIREIASILARHGIYAVGRYGDTYVFAFLPDIFEAPAFEEIGRVDTRGISISEYRTRAIALSRNSVQNFINTYGTERTLYRTKYNDILNRNRTYRNVETEFTTRVEAIYGEDTDLVLQYAKPLYSVDSNYNIEPINMYDATTSAEAELFVFSTDLARYDKQSWTKDLLFTSRGHFSEGEVNFVEDFYKPIETQNEVAEIKTYEEMTPEQQEQVRDFLNIDYLDAETTDNAINTDIDENGNEFEVTASVNSERIQTLVEEKKQDAQSKLIDAWILLTNQQAGLRYVLTKRFGMSFQLADTLQNQIRNATKMGAEAIENGIAIFTGGTILDQNARQVKNEDGSYRRSRSVVDANHIIENIVEEEYSKRVKELGKKNVKRSEVEKEVMNDFFRYMFNLQAQDAHRAAKIKVSEALEKVMFKGVVLLNGANKEVIFENTYAYLRSHEEIDQVELERAINLDYQNLMRSGLEFNEVDMTRIRAEFDKLRESYEIKSVYGQTIQKEALTHSKAYQELRKLFEWTDENGVKHNDLDTMFNSRFANLSYDIPLEEFVAEFNKMLKDINTETEFYKQNQKALEKGESSFAYLTKKALKEVTKQFKNPSIERLEMDNTNLRNRYGDSIVEFESTLRNVIDATTDLAVYYGLITQAEVDRMRQLNPHYVPLGRETTMNYGLEFGTAGRSVDNVIRARQGSNLVIQNLLAQVVNYINNVYVVGEYNTVLNIIYRTARQNGTLNNASDMMVFNSNTDIAARITNINDIDLLQSITEVDTDGTSKKFVYVDENGIKHNMIARMNKQVATAFKVDDMYKMNGLDTLGKMTFTNRVLETFRKLVTEWNLFFGMRNALRDFQDAIITTKNGRAAFTKGYVQSIFMMIHNDPIFKLFLQQAGYSSSFFNAGNVNELVRNMEQAFNNKSMNPFKVIRKLNYFIEMLPRFTEFRLSFNRYMQQGYSEAMALRMATYDAAEVTTDFGRGGTVTKSLNRNLVPFLNASVQGLCKNYNYVMHPRDLKQLLTLLLAAVLLGFLPEMLSELLYGDDEDYEALPDYTKEQYYLIKVANGQFIRLPRGRIIGSIQSFFRNGMEFVEGKDTFDDAVNDFIETAYGNLSPIGDGGFRTIFAPISDIQKNVTWYGGSIDKQSDLNKRPSDRYDTSTSEISKLLGKVFNYSPKRIDYLLAQYTGVVGDFVLPLTSADGDITDSLMNFITDNLTIDAIKNNKFNGEFYDYRQEIIYRMNSGDLVARQINGYLSRCLNEINELEEQIETVSNDAERYTLYLTIRQAYKSAIENAKILAPYLENIDLESSDSKFAITEAYRQAFGAEQALKYYSSNLYERSVQANELGVSFDDFYIMYMQLQALETKQEKMEFIGNYVKGDKRFAIMRLLGIALTDNQKAIADRYLN